MTATKKNNKNNKIQSKTKKTTVKKPLKSTIKPRKMSTKPTAKSLVILWGGITALIVVLSGIIFTSVNNTETAVNSSNSEVLGTSAINLNSQGTLIAGDYIDYDVSSLPLIKTVSSSKIKWSNPNTNVLHLDVSAQNVRKIRIWVMDVPSNTTTATINLQYSVFLGLIKKSYTLTVPVKYSDGIRAQNGYAAATTDFPASIGTKSIKVNYENGCQNSKVKYVIDAISNKNSKISFPSYLWVNRIRFLKSTSMTLNPSGLTMGDSLIAVNCDQTDSRFLLYLIVHELVHAWDAGYNQSTRPMYLNAQTEWQTIVDTYATGANDLVENLPGMYTLYFYTEKDTTGDYWNQRYIDANAMFPDRYTQVKSFIETFDGV